MIQALNAAIAGLRVSAQRLGVAAENIANARSSGSLSPYDGYVPKQLVQSTNATGEPTATTQPISQVSVPFYDPTDPKADANGLIGHPNVDLAANIVDATIAQRSYEANAVVMRTVNDMAKVLFDRTA